MITIKNLSKCFKSQNIIFPDFIANRGDFVLLSGDSGTGKSSFCEIFANFLKPDTGEILIENLNHQTLNVFDYIHYFSQFPEHNLIGPTCFDELELWLSNKEYPENTGVKEIIISALKDFHLYELIDKPVWKLSFGKKKALAYSVISLIDRSVCLLDEPYAGLDVDIIKVLNCILKKYLLKGGIIIATTHNEKPFNDFNPKVYRLKR